MGPRWIEAIDERIDLEIALRRLWCILSEDNMRILFLYCTGWKISEIGKEYDLTSRQIGNKIDQLRRRMRNKWKEIESQY